MKTLLRIVYIFVSVAFMLSCSTTRVLQDGEYRLARNSIEVVNDEEFNTNSLEPYLKQKHKGWNPFLNVYNWSNGKGKGWDKFVQKIGIAPVVYDPQLVDNSIENIDNHLEYLGYYGIKADSETKKLVDECISEFNEKVIFRACYAVLSVEFQNGISLGRSRTSVPTVISHNFKITAQPFGCAVKIKSNDQIIWSKLRRA